METSMLRSLLFLLLVIGTCDSQATKIDAKGALARLGKAQDLPTVKALRHPERLMLAYTHTTPDGCERLYAFNNPDGGFVITSADDQMPTVLGWSDHGTFDASKLPDGLRDLLDFYSLQTKSAPNNLTTAPRRADSHTDWDDVAPLVQTQWDQDSPYNRLLPFDPNDGQRCEVGCVSVAFAQLMYYHRYPDSGEGIVTYDWNGETLTTDLSEAHFEWDKMKLRLGHDDIDDNLSVATLMFYLTRTFSTQYGSYSGSGGSWSSYWSNDLTRYYGYQDNIGFMERSGVTDETFLSTIYNDLHHGLPVLFHSNNDTYSFAHLCVIDGYQQGDYFHFNFGWGGDSDGYYLLSSINTNLATFTTDQHIMYNIQPPVDPIGIDGIAYEMMPDMETARVIGSQTKEALIPETVTIAGHLLHVTSIADAAFSRDTMLMRVSIPASVTDISQTAFKGCFNLEEITVSEQNDNYCSVDGVLFNKSQTRLMAYPSQRPDTLYTLPKTVSELGTGAFGLLRYLNTLCVEHQQPPVCADDAVASFNSHGRVLVPAGSRNSYLSAGGWQDVKRIVETENYDDDSPWYVMTQDARCIPVEMIGSLVAIDDKPFFTILDTEGAVLADSVALMIFTQDNITAIHEISVAARDKQLRQIVDGRLEMQGVQGTLVVYSSTGMEMLRQSAVNGHVSVSVSSLPTGVYVATIGRQSFKFLKR